MHTESGVKTMPETKRDIQEQKKKTKIPSLKESILNTLLIQLGKNPGFFKSKSPEDPVPSVIDPMLPIWQDRLAILLDCAGFGRRLEAESLFKAFPALLLWRGKLTDIAKKTYENITAFEYAVKAKDSYFARKVVNFIETYQGNDRREVAEDLLEQFDRSFSKERLASVNGFIEASNTWCTTYPKRTWSEIDKHFILDVGESQTHFEAHILQRYCNLGSFDSMPQFNEPDLPENLSFHNMNGDHTDSLLTNSPGGVGNFVLVRTGEWMGKVHGRSWSKFPSNLKVDCAAVVALDKARTADLLELRERLVSIILKSVDSLESDVSMPSCSSSYPNYHSFEPYTHEFTEENNLTAQITYWRMITLAGLFIFGMAYAIFYDHDELNESVHTIGLDV